MTQVIQPTGVLIIYKTGQGMQADKQQGNYYNVFLQQPETHKS